MSIFGRLGQGFLCCFLIIGCASQPPQEALAAQQGEENEEVLDESDDFPLVFDMSSADYNAEFIPEKEGIGLDLPESPIDSSSVKENIVTDREEITDISPQGTFLTDSSLENSQRVSEAEQGISDQRASDGLAVEENSSFVEQESPSESQSSTTSGLTASQSSSSQTGTQMASQNQSSETGAILSLPIEEESSGQLLTEETIEETSPEETTATASFVSEAPEEQESPIIAEYTVSSDQEMEEVFVNVGTVLSIVLEGTGWYLAGMTGEGGGLMFKDRIVSSEDEIIFKFTCLSPCEYLLDFSGQDLVNGLVYKQKYRVVISDIPFEEPEMNLSSEVITDNSSILEGVSLPSSRQELLKSIAEIKSQAELSIFVEIYPDFFDSIMDSKLFYENLFLENPLACIWLLEDLLEMNKYLTERDLLYYTLAVMLEKDSPVRNLSRAMDLYQLLMDQYPTSLYWENAEERLNYINRHFFLIR